MTYLGLNFQGQKVKSKGTVDLFLDDLLLLFKAIHSILNGHCFR